MSGCGVPSGSSSWRATSGLRTRLNALETARNGQRRLRPSLGTGINVPVSYEIDQHTATDQPQGVISLDVTIMEGAAKWRDIFDRIEARAAELNAELDHLHRRCERQFGKLLDYLHGGESPLHVSISRLTSKCL